MSVETPRHPSLLVGSMADAGVPPDPADSPSSRLVRAGGAGGARPLDLGRGGGGGGGGGVPSESRPVQPLRLDPPSPPLAPLRPDPLTRPLASLERPLVRLLVMLLVRLVADDRSDAPSLQPHPRDRPRRRRGGPPLTTTPAAGPGSSVPKGDAAAAVPGCLLRLISVMVATCIWFCSLEVMLLCCRRNKRVRFGADMDCCCALMYLNLYMISPV